MGVDVGMMLKEVHVNNFKSLKDVRTNLGNLNVIVGRNGTGKTNFIESFKFLKKVLGEGSYAYLPYADWWSYENVAWMGKSELPIRIGVKMEIIGFEVSYAITLSVLGGATRILTEKLVVDKIFSIEREGEFLKIRHEENFVKRYETQIKEMLKDLRKIRNVKITQENVLESTVRLGREFGNLTNFMRHGYGMGSLIKSDLSLTYFDPGPYIKKNGFVIVLPIKKPAGAKEKEEYSNLPHGLALFESLRSAIERFTILRHPNISAVKSPIIPRKEEVLSEDSSNLHNILYNWFLEKGGKIPERVERAVSALFPGIRIQPSLTTDGKVFIKMFERGVELAPPCMPDGLYKLLAILAAIELKPSLLAIDEIENSLFAEALEYVIDELRNAGITVIITTHSPLIVDMSKLEELLISEMTPEGTVLKRVANPENVRKKLREQKITQSESWLYGDLTG